MAEEKVPMIYAAICGVMEDVGAVGKGDYNKSQGFKYRGIDSVMNALNPAMIKHKIFCTPEVLEQNREERTTAKGGSLIYSVCRMRYRFFTIDGSFVDAVVVGEGMDSGDKATNKAMAVAFKYACFQTFCIPTENLMDDPDADTPDPSKKRGKGQPQQEGVQNPEKTQKREDAQKSRGSQNPAGAQEPADPEIASLRMNLKAECDRTGVGIDALKKVYGDIEKIEDLSKLQLKNALGRMAKTPDKAVGT